VSVPAPAPAPPAGEDAAAAVELRLLGRTVAVPGRYLLYAVPFLWGTFGPAVRLLFMTDPHPEPSVFNSERLLLANAVYAPVLLAEVAAVRARFRARAEAAAEGAAAATDHNRAATRTQGDGDGDDDDAADPFLSIRAGLELGAYVFCANVAQVIGLQSTSASRAAFLVQLQTVFIPVLAAALGLGAVSRNTWIGAVTAVAGVALLSSDKSHGAASSLGGDALEVLSAVFFSFYVLRLGAFCSRIQPATLVAVKIFVQAALSVGWAVGMEALALAGPHAPYNAAHVDAHPWTPHVIAVNVAVVAWTGLMSSAVSGWLQSRGQQSVPPSEAAVIFATQPLWASATAALVLGEAFGPKGFAGGALIVAATVFSSLPEGDDSGGAGGDDGAAADGGTAAAKAD
jgi:drug/metabolite transporter (DMT)-like permease